MKPIKLKQILTIHGVNHDETWQEKVRQVFEPHFEYIPIGYREYLGIKGPLKAVFNLWTIPLVVTSLVAAVLTFQYGNRLYASIALGVTALFVVLGLWLARLQRRSCADRVKEQIGLKTGGHPNAPHVIAHSLGTYLIARILQKYDEITVDRLVLVGAVVPRMFDWESILKKNREAFLEIRNEVGQKDWVVQLVGAIKWFVRDFGNSGLRGAFTGLRHHNLNNPWVPCELCNDVVEPVRYHNVMLQEFLHSDWFLGPGHASKVWLPYLWGYTPQEFKEWQQLCWSATYLAQEHQWRACRQVETILRRRRWAWTTIVDLETYISEEIRETASAFAIALETNDFRTILNDVVRDLHLCVTEAILESKNINGQHSIIRPLHPLIAIARAVINELPIDEAG